MLRDGDPDGLLRTGHLATIMLEVCGPSPHMHDRFDLTRSESIGEVPSLFSLLWYVPASKDMRALEARAQRWVALRAAADPTEARPDIMSFLVRAFVSPGQARAPTYTMSRTQLAHDETTRAPLLAPDDLAADAILAIQAGSDTPAGILTHLFFFLVAHPRAQQALHAELVVAFPQPLAPLPARTLGALPYLDAFVTEALRLGAPFAGLPRVVPPGGAVVAGAHVPGGTTVSVPGWSQHIAPAHFGDDALDFRPERWLAGAVGGADRGRLTTFSFGARAPLSALCSVPARADVCAGPFGCLGEKLALAELQVCLARAVLTYEILPEPGFDADAFRAGALNARTPIFRVPLRVVLRRRARGE
jgi:cytochrome P450